MTTALLHPSQQHNAHRVGALMRDLDRLRVKEGVHLLRQYYEMNENHYQWMYKMSIISCNYNLDEIVINTGPELVSPAGDLVPSVCVQIWVRSTQACANTVAPTAHAASPVPLETFKGSGESHLLGSSLTLVGHIAPPKKDKIFVLIAIAACGRQTSSVPCAAGRASSAGSTLLAS